MRTIKYMARLLMVTGVLAAMCFCMGCGGGGGLDTGAPANPAVSGNPGGAANPAAGEAGALDSRSTGKSTSALGIFNFVLPPTPQNGSVLYDDFTVRLTSWGSGADFYYVHYELLDNNGVAFDEWNYNQFNFEQTIEVPDNYFGYVRLNVDMYGYSIGNIDEYLYGSSLTYIVNTF